MEEHELFVKKLQTRFEATFERITKANAAIDLNVILMGEITERTENFREYFFSRKMIDDAQRELSEKATTDVNQLQATMVEITPESLDGVMDTMFAGIEETVANIEKLVDIAAREVERLDK